MERKYTLALAVVHGLCEPKPTMHAHVHTPTRTYTHTYTRIHAYTHADTHAHLSAALFSARSNLSSSCCLLSSTAISVSLPGPRHAPRFVFHVPTGVHLIFLRKPNCRLQRAVGPRACSNCPVQLLLLTMSSLKIKVEPKPMFVGLRRPDVLTACFPC